MSVIVSATGRCGATGSTLAGSVATGRARGNGSALTATDPVGDKLLLTIGAGCGPDCRNKPLTRMAIAAETPTTQPTASRWLQPQAGNANSRGKRRPAPRSAAS